ncbi:MAG TPA: hypothetical protein EYG74_00655 [Sulfurimonas autotrophica]|nr:hypothetical protein [Sulfurimonas autotrophica]
MRIRNKLLIVSLLATVVLFTGCGGGNNTTNNYNYDANTTKADETPQDFRTIGAIDCRGIKDYGGEVKLRAKIGFDSRIKRDSFTYEYRVNGNMVDFETPIVSMTGDGSAYLLNGDMYVTPNEGDTTVLHVFDLSYLDGGHKRLFRGACQQDRYVQVAGKGKSCSGGATCPYSK